VETTIPKEIPKNTEPPKQTLEGSPKKTPTVFVDNRSKLVITDRFEELKEEKTTPKETPKKNIRTENDLFGDLNNSNIQKESIDFESLSKFNDVEKIEAKVQDKQKPAPKKASSITVLEDDIFGSPKPSSPQQKKASKFDDDDLFSMVDNKSSKSSNSSDVFNIDEYITNAKKSSGGGLFD